MTNNARSSINELPFIEATCNYAVRQFLKSIKPKPKEDIVSWVEANVDLSYDHTSSKSGLVKLYPYQKEILRACDDASVKEVSICAGQRLGKSSIWKYSLLKRVHDGGCSGLILYPSLELGKKTNKDTLSPLLCTLPEVNRDLSVHGNRNENSYHIPSQQSVVYFVGGRGQVISSTANFCIMDESDFVDLQNDDDEDKNMSQLKALRLRMQTFPERMLIVCSSPSQYGGVIWQNYKKGSMGEWNMRCLHCGALSPVKQLAFPLENGTFAGLQWDKDANGEVIEDSIRWICPHCQHRHEYKDAWKMNDDGAFVHNRPSNLTHRSFQIGALANPSLWSWLEIAQAQEDATDGDSRKYLSNTILGMPYKHRAEGDAAVGIEEANRNRQVEYPADLQDRIAIITAGIDQQKSELAGQKYFCSVVRGWDEAGNSWLLSAGTDNSLQAVNDRISKEYYGHRVMLAMFDSGGFDISEDLQPFVESRPNCILYKGTDAKSLAGEDFRLSNVKKLFLCNALGYQVKLLDLMYSPKRPSGYGWYLPIALDDEYFRQLCNVQPNTRMGRDGNGFEYVNWHAFGGARRDFFDSEKMALCCMEIACNVFPPSAFARRRIPAFIVREKLAKLARGAKLRKQ